MFAVSLSIDMYEAKLRKKSMKVKKIFQQIINHNAVFVDPTDCRDLRLPLVRQIIFQALQFADSRTLPRDKLPFL